MRLLSTVGIALALVAGSFAQSSVPNRSGTQAITNVRIEVGDGRTVERGAIVMRDGVIVAVGADAKIPAGAEVFDGKGLTAYPGFLDAWTDRLTKIPPDVLSGASRAGDGPEKSENASAFMPEAYRAGIRPEIEARGYLTLDDETLRPHRRAGFTAAMAVPSGALLSGVGTLVALSGEPARTSVLVPRAGMALSFDGTSRNGEYPDSLLGGIAQVRQSLLDARSLGETSLLYAGGALARPDSDPSLEALAPVLGGRLPLLIEGDTPAAIDRALLTGREFGIRPVLVGGLGSYRRLDSIRAMGGPVIVSLGFGPEPADPAAKPALPAPKDAPKPTEPGGEGDDPGDAPDDQASEDQALTAERARLFAESAGNAAALAKAGIPFAFSTRGLASPADFLPALRAAVKRGLTREAALSGLTLGAARVLGVERRLGSLEAGKIANVTLMTGDFLGDRSKVKMLYIDGRRVDPEAKPAPPLFTPRRREDDEDGGGR